MTVFTYLDKVHYENLQNFNMGQLHLGLHSVMLFYVLQSASSLVAAEVGVDCNTEEGKKHSSEWKFVGELSKMLAILASKEEEFNLRPMMKLRHSVLFCKKFY